MTEGLTVRQLAKKSSLDLEEIIACVVCVSKKKTMVAL